MNEIMTFAPLIVLLVVFYVFQMRSSKKKKKQEEEMRNSLSAGDTITTIGGIFGKVVDVSEKSVVFETSEDRVRMEVAKWAIASTGKASEEQPK
ncbi:MAG: preprotein translocase subunit YajC [Oscillospiraceae bacterium]|jgi:preprotein translocase subunit YajC|nr:preprotein translocase subunit YajC [Oscillospiraceae bacterium]